MKKQDESNLVRLMINRDCQGLQEATEALARQIAYQRAAVKRAITRMRRQMMAGDIEGALRTLGEISELFS